MASAAPGSTICIGLMMVLRFAGDVMVDGGGNGG